MKKTCENYWVQRAVVGVALTLIAICMSGIWMRAETIYQQLVVLTMVATGYALADLVSGVVHWLADHYGTEQTPVAGYMFIKPFREHHEQPQALTEETWPALLMHATLTALPAMGLALAATFFISETTHALALGTLLITTATSGVFACATHRWSHDPHAPVAARLAQQCGLILSPAHHQTHHTDGHSRGFCILNGWMNPVLDIVVRRASHRPFVNVHLARRP